MMGDGGREAGPFQWPFVGLAVLMLLLILTTPSLLGVGAHSAGSPTTSAELVVYRAVHGDRTDFYVMGVETTGFQALRLGLAAIPSWPFQGTPQNLTWTHWSNATDSISVSVNSSAPLVAVNATAVFVDAQGGTAEYQGMYAFNVTANSLLIEPLTPGLSPGVTSFAVTDLPEPLPLLEVAAPP